MPALVLSERQQRALRSLLAAEPVPGRPMPDETVLITITELVACDAIGAVLVDGAGHVLDAVELPHDHDEAFPELVGPGGPLHVGLVHWSQAPRHVAVCHALDAATDGVVIGVRNGADRVAQLYLDRTACRFSEDDLALLSMVTPALARLMRERPTPRLPVCLTLQERRVLSCVAMGHSNAEIAAALFVAPSTVRKHLEHAFRKLGVTSRLAAVAALQGRDLPEQDLQERIERLDEVVFA